MLLSSTYFPPVQYFSKIASHAEITIEACENYQKQSYRNRCNITSANGIILLAIPIQKGSSPRQLIKDVKISYETDWQRIHSRSIMSAYRHSPFYEFFFDEFTFVWEKKENYLFDLNFKILRKLIELSGFPELVIQESKEFLVFPDDKPDWRKIIHPKIELEKDESFRSISYEQVFNDRYGFQPNLSILDTLFQLGPEIRTYLLSCSV